MGSSWEAKKEARRAARASDPLVQGRRKKHAADAQMRLLQRLSEEGDENAKRALAKRSADVDPYIEEYHSWSW